MLKNTPVSWLGLVFLLKTFLDLWPICRCLGFCWLSVPVLRWHWLFEDLFLALQRLLNFQSQRPHNHGLVIGFVFTHRGEGMLQNDCCWRLTQLWQVPGLRSCWELELLPSWCERGSSHLSFFHPAVFCQVFVLSALSLSGSHTNALSIVAISKYVLPTLEAHIFTITSCCVYWDFSQVLSPFITEQEHGLS